MHMQYLSELLNAKRLEVKRILSSEVTITIKEDGRAFQTYTDQETKNVIYGKKSQSPNMKARELTEFDLVSSDIYREAYYFLKDREYLTSQFDILNFEILSKTDKHIIGFDKPLKIVLLSGYLRDKEVPYDTLSEFAKQMNIDMVNKVYTGILPENMIDMMIEHRDDEEMIYDIFKKSLHKKLKSLYGTEDPQIEGFVIQIEDGEKKRTYKCTDPEFKNMLWQHLDDETAIKTNVKNEEVYNQFFRGFYLLLQDSFFVNKLNSLQSSIEKLCFIWKAMVSKKETMKYILGMKTQLEGVNMLNIEQFDVKPLEEKIPGITLFVNQYSDYKDTLMFILYAFKNKRKKYPILCSIEYQEKYIDPFLKRFLGIV